MACKVGAKPSQRRWILNVRLSTHLKKVPGSGWVERLVERNRQRWHAAYDRLLENRGVVLVVRTVQEMGTDDSTHMAASVAYYALFSLFPLVLGLIALFSLFLDPEWVRTQLVAFLGQNLPGSHEFITTNVEGVVSARGALGAFAIIGLLWSGSAVFGSISRAINRAWGIRKETRPFYVAKARHLVMGLGVSILFILSFVGTAVAEVVQNETRSGLLTSLGLQFLANFFFQFALVVMSYVLTLGVFLILYKWMPNTRTYWADIWLGAVIAAFLFELAKNLFILYLDNFTNFQQVYGSLASVMVLLLWSYFSALILIIGAEVCGEWGRIRRGLEQGVLVAGHRHQQDAQQPEVLVD